jgi:tetratricopeptide (TPR) repeat protein
VYRVGLGLLAMAAMASAVQPDAAKELNRIALDAMARGDYTTAKTELSEAVNIWLALGPEFAPHAASEMMNLGDAVCALGDWSAGAKFFEQALELNRRTLGPKHARTVANLNRLANVYLVQGEIDRAEPLFRDALAVERDLYPNDLQTAHSLAGLASIHVRARKWDEALPEAEEGLAITLRAVGEKDAESGMAYANVGEILRVSGHPDRALPLLRKARLIFERTLGPSHPRAASVISQEGLALMYENKFALAEQDLLHAVDLLAKFGGSKVELAVAEHNLGLLRLRQKKYADADKHFSKALALEEEYSSRPGGEMAATLNLLSQVREKENRPGDAAQLKERASTISTYR